MRISLKKFDKGLYLAAPVEAAPSGTLRRGRGIHPLSSSSVRSRNGAELLYTQADTHTISYFADSWAFGAGTVFYHGSAQNYTTFTEVDVAENRITVTPLRVTVSDLVGDEDVYLYKDFTAAYFDDDYEFQLDFTTSGTSNGTCGIWAITNDLDDLTGLAAGDLDHHVIYSEGIGLYSAFTEVDVPGRLTVSDASGLTIAALDSDEDVYLYKDFGAGYFDSDFKFQFDFELTYPDDICGLWAVTNNIDTLYGLKTADQDHLALYADSAGNDTATRLLIHANGADGATNFTDSSYQNHAITAYGDAQIDAISKFGTGSAKFDGSGDYLSIPDSADWYMASSEFTVDFWMRFSSLTFGQNQYEICGQYQSATEYVRLYYFAANTTTPKLFFYIITGGAVVVVAYKNIQLTVGQWYHTAIIRGWGGNVNDWVITVAGVAGNLTTDSSAWPNLAAPLFVGKSGLTGTNRYDFPGRIDEFRVTKGTARWTSNFTPETRAYGPDIVLHETNGTTDTIATLESIDINTTYYPIIERNETLNKLYCYLYTNSARTVLYDTLELALTEQQDFRYLFGMISYGGTTGGNAFYCTIHNLCGPQKLIARETNSSADTTDTSIMLNPDTLYYLTIVRDESVGTYGELTCAIYSDSLRTELVDTLTITLTEKQDFRYLFGMISANNSTADIWGGKISNLRTVTPASAPSSVKTGLSGDRLSISVMPPTAGKEDYMFVAGGGALFKVSSAGAQTNWGIAAPSTNPSAATGAAGVLTGTYKYHITYYNSTTGHRSNANPVAPSVAPSAEQVDLTSIPVSSDGQVTSREIWRTGAGGSVYFYLTVISDNVTTIHTDNTADSGLSSTELPTDNLIPYAWFDDCLGPHNASMFWITRSQAGNRGRLYYSPIGRAESVEGFIEVTGDDDELQKLVRYGSGIGVLSKTRFYQILGTNPYTAREVTGIPGTTAPHTVQVTPQGIFYEAADGVRQLYGLQANSVTSETLERIFRGESVENLDAFTGIISTYARNEYIISDTQQTLSYNLINGKRSWRDIGTHCNALHYAESLDVLAVAVDDSILDFEKEGLLADNDVAFPFEVEPGHALLNTEKPILIQYVHIDINTSNETLTATLILDETEITLGSVSTAERGIVTFPVGSLGRITGVRLSGSIDASVELFGIDIEIPDTAKERT